MNSPGQALLFCLLRLDHAHNHRLARRDARLGADSSRRQRIETLQHRNDPRQQLLVAVQALPVCLQRLGLSTHHEQSALFPANSVVDALDVCARHRIKVAFDLAQATL